MAWYELVAIASAPVDLGGLTSPTEVGIGLAVAYLGFDRFRYRKRVKALAEAVAAKVGKPRDVLKSSFLDKKITSDEKSLLTVFWFTEEDAAFREEMNDNLPELKRSNIFWNGRCYLLLMIFIKKRVDRWVFMASLGLTCLVDLLLGLMLFSGYAPAFIIQPWFVVLYGIGLLACFLAPLLGFFGSELMMRSIRHSADIWSESMETHLLRAAEEAKLNGKGAVGAS